MQLWSKITEIVSGGVNLLRTYRKYVLAACGLIIVTVVFFSSILPALGKKVRETSRPQVQEVERTLADSFTTRTIEPDALFLADEPDFFPQIILSREPQTWSAEDVQSLWVDPLQKGTEQWQEEIKKALDTFMEKVP
ncbi:MAG: hypothetical protein LBO67_09770 [Spirochaetaceae bacterium]|jgi:hypothetical protein|nr:hypothetical protein [Spirochaetaceae bacterium]